MYKNERRSNNNNNSGYHILAQYRKGIDFFFFYKTFLYTYYKHILFSCTRKGKSGT